MIHAIKDQKPEIHESTFVAWNAEVAGSVTLCADTSVWFGATVRADIADVIIGKGSNIQDGSVVHVDTDAPLSLGEYCTVGHGAILHSCNIGNECLIGMGAIILNGVTIGDNSIVGAGSLVTQGKTFPPRSLIMGSPAKLIRSLTDEECAQIKENSLHYVHLGHDAKTDYKEV